MEISITILSNFSNKHSYYYDFSIQDKDLDFFVLLHNGWICKTKRVVGIQQIKQTLCF